MKRNRKRLVLVLGMVIACATGAIIWSRYGGFGTGPSASARELAHYAQPITEITIPEGTRVVALGEATHGNREFQELKLDVFQVLVERHGARAFALEADFGGCELVNRYIHGGDGTLGKVVGNLDFTIYRTDQMKKLVSWMRTYNETAAPGEDLNFYGFDLQNHEHCYQLLLEEMRARDLDTSDLESLGDLRVGRADSLNRDLVVATYEAVRQQLKALPHEDAALALQLVDCLLWNDELGRAIDSPESYGIRDHYMAQNVLWILDREERRGNQLIFISGHNGHIEQAGSYGLDDKVMGSLLADELGDAYFAIGTDFFRAEVNLPRGNGQRMKHTFYSYDPLAHAAASCGYECCWLDFSRVPESSSLRSSIDGPIMMGSVGEGFSPLMYVLPQTYRVKREPSNPYDSMVFVPYAHPTEILPQP